MLFPNAKINIGLWVTGKRPDGFHDIETVFYPIALSDTLEIHLFSGNGKPAVACSGMGMDGSNADDNLCGKAYRLLDAAYGLPPVDIRLHKRIPVGAGLGGGSSDAAFTLHALNRLCRLRLSDAELLDYARLLGSDCAFFLRRQPALGTGKGDVLRPVSLSLSPYHLLLVKPPVFVGTSEAYASVKPAVPPCRLSDLLQLPVTAWRHTIVNVFEESVFARYPEIGRIKAKMYAAGAVYASMSGSGSAVYGLFEQLPEKPQEMFPECFVWHEQLKVES